MADSMNAIDHGWHVVPELYRLRPEAAALLAAANRKAWSLVDPLLLEQVRLRIAALLGNSAGLQRRSRPARERGLSEHRIAQLASYDRSPEFGALERQALALTEQFVIDVRNVSAAELARLEELLPQPSCHDFVVALYLTECTQRLEMLLPRLLAGVPAPAFMPPAADIPGGVIHDALDRYQEAVVLGSDLDLVVTEMVRLRCARTHDCRVCRTVRLAAAQEAGVDETMTAKIDFYEDSDLDERIKIALRITDAFITRPDGLSDATVREAQACFTPQALAEMCLDITKWSTQKIYVCLGTDGAEALPKNEEGVSFFSFDARGRLAGFSASR